jgi:uncharacterized protein YodC (DUF2158 family)
MKFLKFAGGLIRKDTITAITYGVPYNSIGPRVILAHGQNSYEIEWFESEEMARARMEELEGVLTG